MLCLPISFRNCSKFLSFQQNPGLVCVSTALDNSTNKICEINVRFECNVIYYGNVPPTLVFGKVTDLGVFFPVEVSHENHVNASKVDLVQKLSSDSNDRYVCRLPNLKRRGMIAQSNCSVEKFIRICK